ncbi:MAG: class I mannose-6-phosphate isomerase [Acutalibacteraceae bacterium]|nr:class I mannose-6-phosphate isomerase [Acutalibacteraceae bacterium]
MFYNKPVFFEKNRVFRVYTGGKLFADFFGDDSTDGFYPEEWVASSVRALNEGSTDEYEGVSKIKGTDLYLNDAIQKYKTEILGEREDIGILTKILDSAIRLPVQAHPDKSFSEKYFSSKYGKEESWIILATRPDAKIFFGFKDGVSLEDFIKAIDESENGSDSIESLLCSINVKAGDVIYIPAKMVHAIGKGCLLLEVQEPTDFTIQPERWCGEYKLSDREMYLGLSRANALECFDIEKKYPAPLTPKIISDENGVKYEAIIDETITTSFSVRSISFSGGEFVLWKGAAVYVVTEGCGTVSGDNYCCEIKKGDYFLVPEAAKDKFVLSGKNMKVTECFA